METVTETTIKMVETVYDWRWWKDMKEEWKTRQTYLLEGSIQMASTYNSARLTTNKCDVTILYVC